MFSFFKRRKKKSIPPLSDDLLLMRDGTIEWCRSQLSDYLGQETEKFPTLGARHDVLVGSYICGFLQGQCLVNGHLEVWARGDEGLEMIGFKALAVSCLVAILGSDRVLLVAEQLPQISPAPAALPITQMDKMGGSDGMAHAKGEPKQKGGLLNFYLQKNVEREGPDPSPV